MCLCLCCARTHNSTCVSLLRRVGGTRLLTFIERFIAIGHLHQHVSESPDYAALSAKWNHRRSTSLEDRSWSKEQQDVLHAISSNLSLDGSNPEAEDTARRLLYVGGDPGTGKTETMIHACYNAALQGAHVLILCPTGTLVHA